MKPCCQPFHFSIHNLVRVRVCGPDFLMRPITREFASFEDKGPQNQDELDLDISLAILKKANLGDKGKEPKRNAAPDEKIFSWEGRHLLARWRAGLSASDKKPARLTFEGNWLSRFIVSKWIVEPAVRIVIEKKGALMIHAAALTDGEQAVLVAGPGGAGKTTWVLNWLAAGHPYMSDDFTLLNQGRALSYVTPMRLGLMNLRTNSILQHLRLREKGAIALRTAVRRASLGRVKFYYKVMPLAAAPGIKIADSVKISGAIWLTPDTESQTCSPEEIARLMSEVDRAEMHGFGQAAKMGGQELCPDSFWASHRKRLGFALQDKSCFSLRAHELPPQALDSISSLLAWATEKSAGRSG